MFIVQRELIQGVNGFLMSGEPRTKNTQNFLLRLGSLKNCLHDSIPKFTHYC